MKISRQQLNVIIENYLLLEEINETLIRSQFKNALEQLKREFLNTSKFTEMIRKSVVNELGKTHLYIVPKDDPINDNPEVSSYEGYALHVKFVRGEEKPKKEYFDTDIIKDKDLEAAFAEKPITNPIVVIFEKNIKSKVDLKRLLLHELGHVKNNFLKFYAGIDLNVDEVRVVLRKDFQGKSLGDITKVLRREKRLGRINPPGFLRLLERLKKYYDGVFSEPADELSVDEFAVRISALQRDVVAQATVSPRATEIMSFTQMEKKYGIDAAGLALFLDKDVTYEKIDAVAQKIEDNDEKSATG
jgi:hypothetical protein